MKKTLRQGVSTGSCAAAAALAAALWLRDGTCPARVLLTLPSGEALDLPVAACGAACCGVVKDAGDDPDATHGLTIRAALTLEDAPGGAVFRAGPGVGMVTMPGLKIPPGEPAINPVPRRMIEDAVRTVAGDRAFTVEISVPGGELAAKRTFNERLGIVGGISILGTTGRVKPMDEASVFESLALELNTHAARGRRAIAATFAATGETAVRAAWHLPAGVAIQAGNEIGFVLDTCADLGFETVLVAGHPGKMLKVACGSFRTHNRIADGRLEALVTHLALAGCDVGLACAVYDANTTEEAMAILDRRLGTAPAAVLWAALAETARRRCEARNYGNIEVAAAFVDNGARVLGASSNLPAALRALVREGEHSR